MNTTTYYSKPTLFGLTPQAWLMSACIHLALIAIWYCYTWFTQSSLAPNEHVQNQAEFNVYSLYTSYTINSVQTHATNTLTRSATQPPSSAVNYQITPQPTQTSTVSTPEVPLLALTSNPSDQIPKRSPLSVHPTPADITSVSPTSFESATNKSSVTSTHINSSANANTSTSHTNSPALAKVDPSYAGNTRGEYPPQSSRLGEEGTALITAIISAQGTVKERYLKQTSGYPRLDQAALKAIATWRFIPAKIGEQAVEGRVEVPIVYKLDNE